MEEEAESFLYVSVSEECGEGAMAMKTMTGSVLVMTDHSTG